MRNLIARCCLALTLGAAPAIISARPALGAERSCGSLTESRKSPQGPYAEGSSAGQIRAQGVSCAAARAAIRRCVFHRHVSGWVAVAGSDGTDLSRSQIRSIVDAFPRMALIVHGHPSLSRYVTFELAGGRPMCFSTAVAQLIDPGE